MKKERCQIQTFSGALLNILNPTPDSISIIDGAHALSQICRFTGHTRVFYSVAQHSLLVSALAPEHNARQRLANLFHDFSEYALTDVHTSLKQLLPRYKKIEHKFMEAVAKRLDLEMEDFEKSKFYDRLALDIESKALMGPRHSIWNKYKVTLPKDYDLDYTLLHIDPMMPIEAESKFLEVYNKLWLDRI